MVLQLTCQMDSKASEIEKITVLNNIILKIPTTKTTQMEYQTTTIKSDLTNEELWNRKTNG